MSNRAAWRRMEKQVRKEQARRFYTEREFQEAVNMAAAELAQKIAGDALVIAHEDLTEINNAMFYRALQHSGISDEKIYDITEYLNGYISEMNSAVREHSDKKIADICYRLDIDAKRIWDADNKVINANPDLDENGDFVIEDIDDDW